MSSKKRNRRWPSLILAVMLSLSMVFPSAVAFAETAGEDGGEEAPQQTVTVAVETYTPDGHFKVEPTSFPYKDLKLGKGYNTLRNILEPLGELNTEDDESFNTVIKNFALKDGPTLPENGNHIYFYIGKDGSWQSDNEATSQVKPGAVVRVICAKDKEAVGYVNPTEMKVDRDALYQVMAKADQSQKTSEPYKNALAVALNPAADQEAVNQAAQALEKAMNKEVPATNVYIDSTNTEVMMGFPLTLQGSLKPADSTDKIQWSVDDPSVAKIEGGKLVGLKPGQVKVTAKAGSASPATVEFTVVPRQVVYVSIENTKDMETVVNPVAVPMNTSMNYMLSTEALKKAYGEGDIEQDIITDEITGVKVGKDVISNSGDYKWFLFGNNKLDAKSVKENQVVRLIYGKESELGIQSGALKVNKDKMIALMAQVPAEDLADEYSDATMTYDTAKTNLVSADATQKDVDESCAELDKLVHKVIPAESVKVTPDKAKLGIGKTMTVKAEVLPKDTTDKVQWSSENDEIATVDENGLVKGLAKGEVTITATAGKASGKAVITVTEIPVTKLDFDDSKVTFKVGDSKILKLIKTPSNANSPVEWTSSEPNTVSVDPDGMIIGLKEGSATITAEASGIKATCKVTVEKAAKVTEPTVFFQCDDGRKLKANADGNFDLTVLSQGKFVLEGTDSEEPYWQSKKKVDLGSPHGKPLSEEQYWVTSDGQFMPYGLGDATVTVYSQNPLYDDDETKAKVIKTFKINVVKSDVESIQAFCDGMPLTLTKPIPINGTNTKECTVKGKLKGSDREIDIPLTAVTLSETTGDVGYIDVEGNFGFNMLFGQAKKDIAKFKVTMKDGTASTEFAATSKYIAVTGMTVQLPERCKIDRWNGLKGQYVGVEPVMTFTPADASNQTFNVENLNPDIAEYQVNHHNGVVPLKAGKAGFVFTSKENPELKQTVYVEFYYEHPLTSAKVADKLTMKAGDSQELKMELTPSDATEQRFDWSYSKKGIVKITDNVVKNTNNAIAPPVTTHTISALQPGTVEVTGVPFDQTGGAKPVKFTVTVEENKDMPVIDYLKMAKADLVFGIEKLGAPELKYGNEWDIFTLVRSGKTITKDQIEGYTNSAVEAINKIDNPKPTDVERVVLTLGALGVNCTDADGTNLLEKVYNKENLDSYTSNDVAFGLIAYDTRAYDIPKNAKWNREKTINLLLQYQAEDGSFSLNKGQKSGSIDMTAMCLQALAPYYKNSINDKVAKDVSKETLDKVNTAVDKAIECLKGSIGDNCGFGDNSCTTAQVLTALTALKMDPTTAEGFTLGAKNMITNLNSYKSDEGFKYTLTGPYSKSMAATQVPYALDSFIRLKEGKTALYDETDVKAVGESEEAGGEEAQLEKAVKAAVADITAYKNDPSQYSESNWNQVERVRNSAIKKIEKAKSPEAVSKELAKGKERIDKVKTKAQAEAESKAKIKAVEALIKPINPEKPDKAAIDKAREAYNQLSHSEREQVSNIDVLNKAEANWLDANKKGYFYFCMQKITIGQGYLIEPQKVWYVEDDNVGSALNRFFAINGYDASTGHANGWYLSKIYDAKGSREAKVPSYIADYMKAEDLKLVNPRASQFLGEFDYANTSGWVFTNDDVHSPVGAGQIKATDGIVIRFAFTLFGYGSDCEPTGYGDPILPNVTKTQNVIRALGDVYSSPKREELLKDPKVKVAYDKLYEASLNWQTTQEDLDKETAELNKAVEEFNKAPVPVEPEKPAEGWKEEQGHKVYYKDGNPVKGWNLVDGSWYYMDDNGFVTTGWQKVGDTWYYMDSSGAMTTGWQQIGGTWYYMDGSGAMTTGWQQIGGTWYYMNSSGAMTTGWQQVGGYWYYMNSSGAMLTGWQQVGGYWYYMNSSGAMLTGWQQIGGYWYYMNSSGAMLTGWQKIGGYWYYMYSSGQMAANRVVDGWYLNSSGAGSRIA